MINSKLVSAAALLCSWCDEKQIQYDIVSDESDIQGFKLFNADDKIVKSLDDYLFQHLVDNKIHIDYKKIRGGFIVVLTLEAISETRFINLIRIMGEEMGTGSFESRIDSAINTKHSDDKPRRTINDLSLYVAACRLANKITESKRYVSQERINDRFKHKLCEALDQIENNPSDLFTRFAYALKNLGEMMKIGPLQEMLQKQGINWKKSDDGKSIILYIVNATTNAPQPISRISSEELDQPSKFQDQLTAILDFVKGDAPGAFKQRQDEMRNQEKAIRDVAQSVAPKDDITDGADAAQMAAMPK